MTKTDVKTTLDSLIDSFESGSVGMSDTLSQDTLTALTDSLASTISDTVNPNGPHYPSTPR